MLTAVLAAMLSAPLSICLDWVIMQVVASDRFRKDSIAPVGTSIRGQSESERGGGPENSSIGRGRGRGRARRQVQAASSAMVATAHSRTRSHLFSLAPSVDESLGTTLSDDLQQLLSAMAAHRETLSPEGKAEFDGE